MHKTHIDLNCVRLPFWLTLYIVLLGGSYMLYHLVLPIRISFHVVMTLGLVFYLYRQKLPSTLVTVPTLLMVVIIALSVPIALDPRMAFENAWSWMVNLLSFLCLIQLFRNGQQDELFNGLFVAGGIIVFFAIIEFLILHKRPDGIFFNINLTGAYAAALVIPTIGMAKDRPKRWRFYLLAAALVLTVLMADSRGGLLSVGVASLAYITFTWQKPTRYKLILWFIAGCSLFAALVLLSIRPHHGNGDIERADIWRAGGDMIQNYPMGVGAGLFAQAYRQIGKSGENRFADAHNHIITLGAELGAPGLACGAVILLTFLYSLIKVKLSPLQYAVLSALLGVGVHLLFDSFPSDNWAFLVALYAAFLIKDDSLEWNSRVIKLISAWAAIGLLYWTARMLQFDRAQIAYETGLNTGRYYDVYEASVLDPDMKLYTLTMERMRGIDISHLDPDLAMYGLTMYGRVFK